MSSSSVVSVLSPIFRIYIGAKKDNNSAPTFNHVLEAIFGEQKIDPNLKEFDFMLQFATDEGNGTFKAQWKTDTYYVQAIKAVKIIDPNIKVVVSIGGPSEEFPKFDDPSHIKDEWILKARNSIKKLIDDYALDGIDINYGRIQSDDDFSDCIGGLINGLVKDGEKKIIVSISPSCLNESLYRKLYLNVTQKINWVNYQIYGSNDATVTEDDVVKKYTDAINFYAREKLLLGFSTDPKDFAKLEPTVFFKGIDNLIGKEKLPGLFSWDAAHSYEPRNNDNNFRFEKIAVKVLVDQN